PPFSRSQELDPSPPPTQLVHGFELEHAPGAFPDCFCADDWDLAGLKIEDRHRPATYFDLQLKPSTDPTTHPETRGGQVLHRFRQAEDGTYRRWNTNEA